MPGLTLDLKPNSELSKRIISGIQDRVLFSKTEFQKKHNKWIKAEDRAVAFLPERSIDALRRLDRDQGGKPQYTTIQLPYSYAILMASHTYWTTVFLGRSPVMQFSGRHGEGTQQIQAMEALIDYQVQVGEMLVPLYLWLLDGGKYGIGVLGNFWEKQVIRTSEIVETEKLLFGRFPTGKFEKKRVTKVTTGYEGNKLYNVRPYDFFPDPRVPVYNFQKGEFCAVYVELGWNDVLRRAEQGIYVNVENIKEQDAGGATARQEGSPRIELPGSSSFFSSVHDRKSANVVKMYECHIDLIPTAWGLGKSALPEKWAFTCTSDFTHLLGAQPLGALHDKFPFSVIEFEPEGYGLVPRGIPEVLEPIQNTLDWLINSHLYNVRKAINNQFVVDPSKIVMRDLLDPGPGGIIRLRPEAFGTDARLAVHQLQVVDITQNHMKDMQVILDMGQRTLGVSDQILGMLNVKGRRSATEVRSSTTFGVNRLKTTAEYFSAMGWAPLAQMMVQNSQQYYDSDRKFKITGDLMLEAGQRFVNITPGDLVGFFDFVPVDGTLPVDRFAQANLWRELMGQMQKFPELIAQYDLGRIFAWVAKLAGLKNIDQFKVEVRPDALLAAEAEKGNIVPLGTGATRDLTRIPTGQVSGTGPTG